MAKRKAPPGCFWRGDVLFGRFRPAGKPAWKKSLNTNDPQIASERLAALKGELIGKIKHGEKPRMAMVNVIADWGGKWLQNEVGPETVDRYLTSIKMLEPWLDGKFVDQINGDLIIEIVEARLKVVTKSTVKRDLGALSSVMNYCVDKNYIDANPVLARLGRIKVKAKPIILPDHGDVKIIVKRAPGRLADIIRAALATGCRMNELVAAKRTQFADNKRQLTVIGKGNKMRTIDLSDEAFKVIRDCASDGAKYLFSHHDGMMYREVSSRWRNLCDGSAGKAGKNNDGITPFPFHNLRHLYAVDYLKTPLPDGRSPSIYILSKHLGHTSVKTTEIYLAFLSPKEQHAVMFGEAA